MVSASTILALGLPIPPPPVVADLAGDLAPSVAFGGALAFTAGLAGDLAPSVVLNGTLVLGGNVDLAGDLAPQVAFSASGMQGVIGLKGDLTLDIEIFDLPPLGNVSVQIAFGSAALTTGWLWVPEEPCQVVDWEPSELCNG
jgi:hypothetical protein